MYSNIFKKLDRVVSKIWGYPPSKLTSNGAIDASTDLYATVVSGVMILFFGNASSNNITIQWIALAVFLVLAFYVFLPRSSRLVFGKYDHYIDDGKEE